MMEEESPKTTQATRCLAKLHRKAQSVSEEAQLIAATLNSAPVTLAGVARECALTASAVRQASSTHSQQAIASAAELVWPISSLLTGIQGLIERVPASGDQLVIVWNESDFKKALRSLTTLRTSLYKVLGRFVLECQMDSVHPALRVTNTHDAFAMAPDWPLKTPSTPTQPNSHAISHSSHRHPRFRIQQTLPSPPPSPPTTTKTRPSTALTHSSNPNPSRSPSLISRRKSQLCNILHLAIDKGTGANVIDLLRRGADPNMRRPATTLSPLHRALNHGKEPVATILATGGANVNEINVDDEGRSALTKGILKGFSERYVAVMCEMGAEVDAIDNEGSSALHHAASMGREDDVIGLLVLAGADVNLPNDLGYPPLACAVLEGKCEAAQKLLEFGADMDMRLPDDKSFLHLAIHKRDLALCGLLAEWEADLSRISGDHTPLTLAISTGSFDIARLLIDEGAEVNQKTPSGNSPLLAAATAGNLALIQLLLARGAAPKEANGSGYTPIHVATQKNRVDVLRELVAAGSPIDPETHEGETPLWMAVRQRQHACVDFLIDVGADVNHRASLFESLLSTALKAGDHVAVTTLVTAGADATAPFIDERGEETTPLHWAAERALDSTIALMARAGADLEARVWPAHTPLFTAARAGHLATMKTLLQHGADVRARSLSGESLIFVCTAHLPVLKFLLGMGREVMDSNHRDHYGATALHHAGLHGRVAAAKMLLQRSARSLHANAVYDCLEDFRAGARYRQGTPAGVARQRGHGKVADVIDRWKYKR